MADRTTSSCFSSLKEALLYPARNCRFLAPLLRYVVLCIYVAVKFVYIAPLTREMGHHLTEMQKYTDPSSADYARLLEEVRHQSRLLLLISIATALLLLTLAFPKRIAACFTTCSGDRYSLTELLRQVVKYAKGPLVIMTVVTMLQVTSSTLVGAYYYAVSGTGLISVLGVLAFIFCLVTPWLFCAVTVIVAASVVVVDDVEVVITVPNEGCCGARGLRKSWWLITHMSRKQGLVLVLLTLLLPTVLIPLYTVVFLCTEKGTGMWLRLLSADSYNLLSSVVDIYYLVALMVYSAQRRNFLATESKEVVVATDDGYAQVPSGEENI